MILKKNSYYSLLVALLIVSCGGDVDSNVVNIEIINTTPEIRIVTTEETNQPNCGGTESIENIVSRSRAITHIIEVGGEFTVSAEGSVGISGTNVQLGAAVASHLSYTYGTEEILERSVIVKAAPGSHMMHTIEQQEIWDIGEAIVTINGQETNVPFSFRRDFAVQAINSVDSGCPSLTPQVEPEISTEPSAEVTQTPTRTLSTGYHYVSLDPIAIQDAYIPIIGLQPGLRTLGNVKFEIGKTTHTQCNYIPDGQTKHTLEAKVANPIRVHVLITGTAVKLVLAEKEVGIIRLVFSNGNSHEEPLIPGYNIRNWATERFPEYDFVETISPNVQEVHAGFVEGIGEGVIDMLTIEVPENLTQLDLERIEIWDTSVDQADDLDPCLYITGVTVEHLK